MRQHAPEDCKRRRWLLVEFPKRGARQLLEVVCELQRRWRADGHVGGETSPSKIVIVCLFHHKEDMLAGAGIASGEREAVAAEDVV
jgi:hypothetical protein